MKQSTEQKLLNILYVVAFFALSLLITKTCYRDGYIKGCEDIYTNLFDKIGAKNIDTHKLDDYCKEKAK